MSTESLIPNLSVPFTATGIADGLAPDQVTVAQLCQYWLRVRGPKVTDSHFLNARRYCRYFTEAFGAWPVVQLRPAHVIAWVAQHKRWSTGMKYCVTANFLAVINLGVDHGLLLRNHLRGIRKEFEPGPRRPACTGEQFQALLRAATDPMVRRFLVFVGWTGARFGEAAYMRWSDVDFGERQVVLHVHKTVGKTKQPRRIPLMLPALKLLLWMHRRTNDPEGFVFALGGGKHYRAQSWSKRMAVLRIRAGLPGNITMHTLRHRWITELVARGVPVKIAGEAAGQRSIKTTEQYVHLDQRMDVVIGWLDQVSGQKVEGLVIPPPIPERLPPAPKPKMAPPPAPLRGERMRTWKAERQVCKCVEAIEAILCPGESIPAGHLRPELLRQGHSHHSIKHAMQRLGLAWKRKGYGGNGGWLVYRPAPAQPVPSLAGA